MDRAEEGELAVAAPGEHDVETHPHLVRRMLMAAGVALGLFILGLVAEAHAATPSLTLSATPGPMATAAVVSAQG
jgi:hypothetical protein